MQDAFPRLKVYTALAAGLVAFGFSPIFVRFTPETPALVLAAWRTFFAVLLLFPYWFLTKAEESFDLKGKLLTALAGLSLGLHFILWISSLYYTSVASAAVLVTIHPVILILVERIWLNRRFGYMTWLGVFLAFLGSVFLGISDGSIEQGFSNPLLGNLLALSAALVFVVYILIGQRVRQQREWINYLFPVYLFAALMCVSTALIFGHNLSQISLVGAGSALGMAIFPQIIGHGSMNYAVKYISPTLLSTLILTEPLFATFLAFLLFNETPPVTSLLAMCLIITGVGLTWRRRVRSVSKAS